MIPLADGCQCQEKYFAALAFQLQGKEKESLSYMCGRDPLLDLQKKLRYAEDKSFFVSSEEFDVLEPEQITKLHGVLEGYSVTLILVHRNLLQHVQSYYIQLTKHNLQRTFEEFLVELPTLPLPVNYSAILDNWKHIKAKSIHLISYDHLLEQGADIWEFILEKILRLDLPHRDEKSSQQRERKDASHPLHVLSIGIYCTRISTKLLVNSTAIDLLRRIDRFLRSSQAAVPLKCTTPWFLNRLSAHLQIDGRHSSDQMTLHGFTLPESKGTNLGEICDIDWTNNSTLDILQHICSQI